MTTLAGIPAERARINMPRWGTWRADVTLTEGTTAPTGAVSLVVAGLALSGTIIRSGLDAGSRPRVTVIGGAGGWRKSVARPLSYQSSAGVKLRTVLGAIAAGAGETVDMPPDVTIGSYYELVATRAGQPVRWADALAGLVADGHLRPWRVDPDGVTRFGPRTSAAVSERATLVRQDNALGTVTYGVDTAAEWLPGNTIDSITIDRAQIDDRRGRTEVTIWRESSAPPIAELVRRMVAHAIGETAPRSYVVSGVNADGTVNVKPPPEFPNYPEIRNVERWTVGGLRDELQGGENVIVVFRDGRRSRPVIVGVQYANSGTWDGIAGLGDTVTVLLPPSTLVGNFVGTVNGAPATGQATGMVIWPGQTLGNITTASGKVKRRK